MNNEQHWIRRPLTGDDVADLREEFAACDADGDGCVNFGEFESLLQMLDSRLAADQRRIEFSRIDTDGSGRIDLAEFSRWWQGN